MKFTESKYMPEEKLLVTRLGGDVDLEDIKRWEASLNKAIDQIQPGTSFKAFINLHGFKAVNIEAHKAMRNVIPLTLAKFNFKAGYVDLFEDAALLFSTTNGIQCVAAVHVHNDEEKIKLYKERFDKEDERFFTDPDDGEKWIKSLV